MVSEDIGREFAIDEIAAKADALRLGSNKEADEFTEGLTSTTDEKVVVYSMQTGEPKEILKNSASRVLRKKLSDGRPAHWIEGMPGKPPEYTKGNIKCMLHPKFDETDGAAEFDRAFVDEAGLQNMYCNQMAVDKPNRADFPTVYTRNRHMEKKHPVEWAAIQAALELRERGLERAERRADREALLALARPAPEKTPKGK